MFELQQKVDYIVHVYIPNTLTKSGNTLIKSVQENTNGFLAYTNYLRL